MLCFWLKKYYIMSETMGTTSSKKHFLRNSVFVVVMKIPSNSWSIHTSDWVYGLEDWGCNGCFTAIRYLWRIATSCWSKMAKFYKIKTQLRLFSYYELIYQLQLKHEKEKKDRAQKWKGYKKWWASNHYTKWPRNY